MRRIVYGAGVIVTTDDVADALMQLTAALANLGQTAHVRVPAAADTPDRYHDVAMIVGPGIPMLTEPAGWQGEEPDFSTSATLFRMHPAYPYPNVPGARTLSAPAEVDNWDPDLDGY